ncbi:hypothetical protein DMENIID0001_125080 [Sergentomyia squamirostris]
MQVFGCGRVCEDVHFILKILTILCKSIVKIRSSSNRTVQYENSDKFHKMSMFADAWKAEEDFLKSLITISDLTEGRQYKICSVSPYETDSGLAAIAELEGEIHVFLPEEMLTMYEMMNIVLKHDATLEHRITT